jgi:hypothetical protein
MGDHQALVKIAPEPGGHNIPWQAVARAIQTNEITDITDIKMPYLADVTIGDFVDQLAKGNPSTQREVLDTWMSAAITEFDKTAAMIHLISSGRLLMLL